MSSVQPVVVAKFRDIVQAILKNRSSYSTVDELATVVAQELDMLDYRREIAFIIQDMEVALVQAYRPQSIVDFHAELNDLYYRLKNLMDMVENEVEKLSQYADDEISFKDITAARTMLLRTLQVGQDYLKLILSAQRELYSQKKVQEFMDYVLEIVGRAAPEAKAEILKGILGDKYNG